MNFSLNYDKHIFMLFNKKSTSTEVVNYCVNNNYFIYSCFGYEKETKHVERSHTLWLY